MEVVVSFQSLLDANLVRLNATCNLVTLAKQKGANARTCSRNVVCLDEFLALANGKKLETKNEAVAPSTVVSNNGVGDMLYIARANIGNCREVWTFRRNDSLMDHGPAIRHTTKRSNFLVSRGTGAFGRRQPSKGRHTLIVEFIGMMNTKDNKKSCVVEDRHGN